MGLLKSPAARSLAAPLRHEYWSYAVKYASHSLLCFAKTRSLPFGATVVAQVLGHRDVKFPESRSLPGKLFCLDFLQTPATALAWDLLVNLL